MRDTPGPATGDRFETDVPARLDRLPWSGFHWRVVIALGITWVLDGLEVTLVGSLAGAIHQSPSLALTSTQIGLTASAYLVGAVVGALGFGWLADRIGRRRLFFVTLIVYMLASIATGFAWNFWSFALFRALTGAGIGGEYAAVNSAIQELIPARYRGTTDLCVNGTFWGGAAIGAVVALVVLDPAIIDPEIGWRAAFVVGGALSLVVLLLRRHLPESPRWLMLHGRPEEAGRIVGDIERDVEAANGPLPPPSYGNVVLHRRGAASLGDIWATMFGTHRDRAILGLVLMSCQAFFYNAVFFTYALVLTKFYGIPAQQIGWFMLPFALGNLAGPLLLGRFFDTIGRKPMITGTYALSGLLMAGDRPRLRRRLAVRLGADGGLDGDLLLRLRRSLGGLPDGGRELPAGDAGDGDRPVLRHRHRGRRRGRPDAVRLADRERRARRHHVGLPGGGGADAGGGGDRMAAGLRRRGPVAGGRLGAALGPGKGQAGGAWMMGSLRRQPCAHAVANARPIYDNSHELVLSGSRQ